jgi:hypothetical protein
MKLLGGTCFIGGSGLKLFVKLVCDGQDFGDKMVGYHFEYKPRAKDVVFTMNSKHTISSRKNHVRLGREFSQ